MFNPNSIKTLRTMSASSQKSQSNKILLEEINSAIEEIREWKKNENLELKKQLMENQQANKIIYKSGYEIDDDEEDTRQEELMKQEAELNRKLQRIRQEYMKEYLQIPKYMSSEQKTLEVNQKLQESSQRLENMENYPQNNFDMTVVDKDLLAKLTEWKAMLSDINEIDGSKNKEQEDHSNLTNQEEKQPNEEKMKDIKEKIRQEMNIYQQEEQQISEQQKQSQEFNQNMQQELNDLDKDFDEIDSLLNQCGIK